jgi:hypothetical protein
MQPGSQEPEKYSIDEMMDRLKNIPTEKQDNQGELVTREDGTQVIRIRKRKRRSVQPQREREKTERKQKFARLLLLLVLFIIVTGSFSGAIIYSNSGPFRNALTRKISNSTGAEAELVQFRMNPTGANANTLQLNWPEGFPIESIHTRGLRADTSIQSLFGGRFIGDELVASEGTLIWRSPDRSKPLHNQPLEFGNIDFQRISIARLNILPIQGMQRMLRLRNAEASFYPNLASGGNPQMRLNGGQLQVQGLPKLNLQRALMEFRGNEIHLSIAELIHGADQSGALLLSGTLQPLDENSTAILAVETSSFNIEGIVGERMGRIIVGRIDSSSLDGASSLTIPIGDPSTGILEIDFKSSLNSPMLFKGFNFLAELAMLLEEPWFEQPYFDSDVTGIIRRSGGSVEIRNLQAEYRNRMALRGSIRMEESGRLSGTIDVGLTPALITTAPTRRLNQVVSEASGGYRWITIEIGGNINAPTDNFMSIVDNPPSPTTSPPPTSGSGGTSFEDLTRPR